MHEKKICTDYRPTPLIVQKPLLSNYIVSVFKISNLTYYTVYKIVRQYPAFFYVMTSRSIIYIKIT